MSTIVFVSFADCYVILFDSSNHSRSSNYVNSFVFDFDCYSTILIYCLIQNYQTNSHVFDKDLMMISLQLLELVGRKKNDAIYSFPLNQQPRQMKQAIQQLLLEEHDHLL